MYDIMYIYICIYYILIIFIYIATELHTKKKKNFLDPLRGASLHGANSSLSEVQLFGSHPHQNMRKTAAGSSRFSRYQVSSSLTAKKNGRKFIPCLRKLENLDGSWWLQVPKCSCMLNSHTSSSARSPSACEASISTAKTKHLQRLRVEVCWGYTLAWNLHLSDT